MPEDTFPVEVVQGVPVVAAPEEIDITNAEALRAALLEASANGHDRLVVDMTRTQFCDSSGLRTLIAAHKRAEAEGREVLLVIPGTAVLRVFALTGMDRVIPNFTSLPEALAQTAASANGHSRQRNEGDAAPKTNQGSLAPAGALPGTLKRSSKEAQQTFHQGAYQCRDGTRGRGSGVTRRVRRIQADVREARRPMDPQAGLLGCPDGHRRA